MEDRLKHILGLTNESLRFAEAKNGVLVVAIATILASLLFHGPDKSLACARMAWAIACMWLFLAGFLCLCSFVPKLGFTWELTRKQATVADNPFYFGHVRHYSAKALLDMLYQADGSPYVHKPIEFLIAGQIVIIAGIATRKYHLFTAAIACALVGMLLLGVAGVIVMWN